MQASRRQFLSGLTAAPVAGLSRGVALGPGASAEAGEPARSPAGVTLFLCGDVMPGRGIDQMLAHPSDPRLYEPYVASAMEYLELAERAHGKIPRPVDDDYIWGDALRELERSGAAARIVNLETAITTASQPAPKGINYRMHPSNIGCLEAAKLDCCVLANNHVLDWGRAGLEETLAALRKAGIRSAGAGLDQSEAETPAIIQLAGGARILVFGFGMTSSGIPEGWAAGRDRPGVNLLPELGAATQSRLAREVARWRQPGDIAVASIHWGDNWGYDVPAEHRRFARGLIDAGFDAVHGHSSHHPKGLEIYRDRLILYGCGDFLNDYEGISGFEQYRGDLALMYLPRFSRSDATLLELRMIPFRIRNFRLQRASDRDATWLRDVLDRESRHFQTGVALDPDGVLIATPS
jgi:poly-gamma-glutamate capsule biosynthesis protein CapA/YwtB (metallophosphatase superfamily)